MQIQKAQKSKTKIKMALSGPSGAGKTYSSLLLASGMTLWEKICVIDTENGSANLYDSLGEYNVISLEAPYTPERYIEAIDTAIAAGMEVIIIDSMTHEWDGKGGVLAMHAALPGNSFTNWAKMTPRHNAFIDKILSCPAHVIATIRSKQDYVLVEKNGKQVPEKVGLKAVTRDGVEYEFTLVFDLNIKNQATTSKDRTRLFANQPEFLIGPETGKTILDWCEKGIDPNLITPEQIKRLHALLSVKGQDKQVLYDHFQVTSTKQLTKEQAEASIKKLSQLPDKKESEQENA